MPKTLIFDRLIESIDRKDSQEAVINRAVTIIISASAISAYQHFFPYQLLTGNFHADIAIIQSVFVVILYLKINIGISAMINIGILAKTNIGTPLVIKS